MAVERRRQQDGARGSVTFQSWIVPSSPTVASVWPSGLNTAALTQLVCPVNGGPSAVGRAGFATFQRRTVLSSLAVASVRPSGLNEVR